ncbi:MAG: HAMP domain-containing histidine kinase [Gammaproteobacteria bacterium]|nr:HAMP domain-containing histidine kinase [Gammaproteobacteria bacterium]
MLRKFSRSLSFRLLAIFVVLAAMFVFGAFTALKLLYNSDEIRGLISGHLSLHVHYVKEDIGSPPRIERAIAITESVPVDIRILGPDLDWASDSNFPLLKELEFGPSPKFSDDPDAWVDELQDLEFAVLGRHRFLKIQQDDYQIVVSTPRIADVSSGPDIITIIVGLGLLYLAIGYLAVRWLFKPISAIRGGAAHIGRGNLEHRIRNIRKDQLGDLANDINKLAGDVEHMLDAKRALLLGISHELRTPMSRMRLALEFLENPDDRENLRSEIVEMEKIVVSLLEAERLATRHESLSTTLVDAGALLDDLIDDFFSRDRARLHVTNKAGQVEARIDEARISLMLKNLISNALRYSTDEDGRVEVCMDASDTDLVWTIKDYGPGMSSDQARHIGEPFYRGDPSRTRGTGGTGLGLYLAQLVAEAHQGTLTLQNPDQPGACFECRIPLDLT